MKNPCHNGFGLKSIHWGTIGDFFRAGTTHINTNWTKISLFLKDFMQKSNPKKELRIPQHQPAHEKSR